MFGSTILDVAIGLIFSFLIVSLVTSAATETIASVLSWRANTLLQGIKELLNDPNFSGLALRLYNHAAVNARSNGAAESEAQLNVKPSYIDAKQFAVALIDVAGIAPGANVAALQATINASVQDLQLRALLNGIVERTGGNINRIRDEIASWFDTGMDRVAGVYKRKTQVWAFCIGLALAVTLNMDSVKITQALWNQPMIMKGFAPPSQGETAQQAFDQLQSLGIPFGWNKQALDYFASGPNWLYVIVGWLITAIATLFGAPFWFDALQKFVQLRGAGSK
jgi:Pyruvate/2-oxoacid:ferredoxin oxidoreductase gamma subunit